MLRRRLDETLPKSSPDPSVVSSTEEGRARSAVVSYVVVGEHEDETIRSLAEKFSPSAESSAVECAVRDLIGEEVLRMDGDKVVAGTMRPSGPVDT